ncbi:MAG: hypothetical protein H6Q30_3119 [Bacteroidetes bacterium]|nr:hypothetical protein [Bacteroidota bacterium]
MVRQMGATPVIRTLFGVLLLGGTFISCTDEEAPLAPYAPGQMSLTQINVEDSVYVPRISWGGGYVSGLGVNRGGSARLDTSLAWLIHRAGNAIPYQQRFGQLPSGAEDLTTTFGGRPTTILNEDQLYTFWVAREDVWGTISANPGKLLLLDTALATPSRVSGDSIFLSQQSFNVEICPIDLYIGIKNLRPVGRLGVIEVIQTDTSNAPILRWRITQTGTPPPDTLLANIGIAGGDHYEVSTVVWEVLAVDTSSGQRVYWTRDVIVPPLIAGQEVPGTDVFTAFPATGLQRNLAYYVWIANMAWDQRNRTRSAYNYAYATFETY